MQLLKIILVAFSIALLPLSAQAADDKKQETTETEKPAETKPEAKDEKSAQESAGRYAPDFCDFEMTFPEAPLQTQRCTPAGECYTLYSYTMVYDLQTPVDISLNCTPSTSNYETP